MKKIIIVTLVLLITATTQTTYAHNHHPTMKMTASDSLMQKEMAEHQQMEAVTDFPNYHPLIVHFPIVLLLMSVAFQLLSFFFFKREFSIVTLILLALGVITAWLASNTFHAMPGTLTGSAKEIFAIHEQMASLTWWFSLIALLIKIPSHFYFLRKWWIEGLVALLLIASAVTVSIAGHHGAMLVYLQGIGPQGKYLGEYKFTEKGAETATQPMNMEKSENEKKANKGGEQEENHHVGELGKGPHEGTIEEADPYHIEIVADNNDLIFYLLDGDAKPIDMKNVTGNVKMLYENKKSKTIELMEMDSKQTAMQALNGQLFTATCTLTKNGKSYSASFDSKKDLFEKK